MYHQYLYTMKVIKLSVFLSSVVSIILQQQRTESLHKLTNLINQIIIQSLISFLLLSNASFRTR